MTTGESEDAAAKSQYREEVQDVARDVYALITILLEQETPEATKHAMREQLFARAPEWTLLATAGICAWRWQRLAGKLPRDRGRRPRFPRSQLVRSGGPASDRRLVSDCLDLVEAIDKDPRYTATSAAMIDAIVEARRGPNAFLVLLEVGLDLALMLIDRSPMARSHRELIQQESVIVETDYLARFAAGE